MAGGEAQEMRVAPRGWHPQTAPRQPRSGWSSFCIRNEHMATGDLRDAFVPAGRMDAADRRIQAALERVARGTFGLCADCEQPIERLRLDHAPLTERCASCADLHATGNTGRRAMA